VLVTVDARGTVHCRVGAGRSIRLGPAGGGPIRCALAFADGGRTVIATAGHDAVIRTWVAATGEPAGPPLAGHDDWVGALAWLEVAEGTVLLVSGSDDRTLCFWEPASGRRRRRIPFGLAVRSLAAAGRELTVMVDEGEAVIMPCAGLLTAEQEGGGTHAGS
jgi:WD40 repeat protein